MTHSQMYLKIVNIFTLAHFKFKLRVPKGLEKGMLHRSNIEVTLDIPCKTLDDKKAIFAIVNQAFPEYELEHGFYFTDPDLNHCVGSILVAPKGFSFVLASKECNEDTVHLNLANFLKATSIVLQEKGAAFKNDRAAKAFLQKHKTFEANDTYAMYHFEHFMVMLDVSNNMIQVYAK